MLHAPWERTPLKDFFFFFANPHELIIYRGIIQDYDSGRHNYSLHAAPIHESRRRRRRRGARLPPPREDKLLVVMRGEELQGKQTGGFLFSFCGGREMLASSSTREKRTFEKCAWGGNGLGTWPGTQNDFFISPPPLWWKWEKQQTLERRKKESLEFVGKGVQRTLIAWDSQGPTIDNDLLRFFRTNV